MVAGRIFYARNGDSKDLSLSDYTSVNEMIAHGMGESANRSALA